MIDMFEGELTGYEALIADMQGQANRTNALALFTRLRQYHGTPVTCIRTHARGSDCLERKTCAVD